MPDAEIIAIGSELLTPQKVDTNSLYLTDQLNALGVEVVRKTVVGDDRVRLTDTILDAIARSQIIVLTGGLGPTEDDLTRFFRVVGMPESDLDQLIAPIYTRYNNPITTILAVSGEIHIHLRARSASAEEAEALLEEVCGQIEPLLGDRIYSRNGDSLEKGVGQLLTSRQAHLSGAESATRGWLSGRITPVPSSSSYSL